MKKHISRRRFLEFSAGVTVAATGLSSTAPFVHADAATATITLDGKGTGRTFDGIGAISGGGGNSRLLLDYPEPYRSQILDYLFKPNYGANLHILKVEVGGDTNSTDGSEASFMHTATDQNFNRGYEWWLMQQAKLRNPQIKLYGLAWGAPGWIGTTGAPVYDTNNRFWSQDMINYYIAWIKGAKTHYGLTIDYIGGWNERGYNKEFYENFKQALLANKLATKIVGADSDWSVADAMVSDAAFNDSIDIVGVHYPCTGGDGGSATSCPNTANARSLGKQLWASENGSQDEDSGAIPMARAINRGYIDGAMTAYINWPLIAAIYPNLPYNTVGLMVASQPWSGNYSVGKQLWVTAHTTQFTRPGWHYIDTACGYLSGSDSNGSYVTITPTQGSDYSVIIETVDATTPQAVTFQATNGLSTRKVHVWSTNLLSSDARNYFVRQPDITPSSGTYTVTLQPGCVYTLTTTTGQGKGTITSPAPAALGLPYADTFDSYAIGREAQYFSDMNGAFEIVASSGGHQGKSLRQMAPTAPISWDTPGNPYTLLGDLSWRDYTVSSDVLLEQSGTAEIMGRVTAQAGFNPNNINAYYLSVKDTGAWSIQSSNTGGNLTALQSGTVAALGTNTWHNLALGFQGNVITAYIDQVVVGTVTDSTYSTGQVGLGVAGWQNVQFDNFKVVENGSASVGTPYALINRLSGKVLAVSGASTLSGAAIIQSTENDGTSQQWQLVATNDGYVKLVNVNSGDVLDVPSNTHKAGQPLDQQSSKGEETQQWMFENTGDGYYTIVNRASRLVVDVAGASTADAAPVVQARRSGSQSQQWQLFVVPTLNSTYRLENRNSGQVMDVSGQSTSDGGIVIQYPNNGGANQQWRLLDAGGGYYTLVNANSGKVLDDPNSSTTPGQQLEQWTANGGANQQWRFVSIGGGYYTIVSRNSGLVIDVAGSSLTATAAVIQGTGNSSKSQQWQFVPVY